jgi:hypothetical protein
MQVLRPENERQLKASRVELPPAMRAFGGELPLGCDRLLKERRALADNCLAFSHSRAALGWLCDRLGPFDQVVLSAYTCPTLPRFFSRVSVAPLFVDAMSDSWERAIASCSGRLLVLIPAFLGHDPQANIEHIAALVGDRGVVVIDAAQTAFGHETIQVPDGVVVVSGPRKCTALSDGAILRWTGVTAADQRSVAALPWALEPVGKKLAARAIGVTRWPETESDMLALTSDAERSWPDAPHRMSDAAVWGLAWIDPAAHAQARWRNWKVLDETLSDCFEIIRLSGGTPFNFSMLSNDRDALLLRLRSARVFATALWPDAVHAPADHPVANDLARRLIGLPIDPRYCEDDMHELASCVRGAI